MSFRFYEIFLHFVSLFWGAGHTLTKFYLGFIIWERIPKWLMVMSFLGGGEGFREHTLRVFFKMNMYWDAIWCTLRHNFEKHYSVSTELDVSELFFFRNSYLHTVMITVFFCRGGEGGVGGSWEFWGGSFYPSNTPDRTPFKSWCFRHKPCCWGSLLLLLQRNSRIMVDRSQSY